MMRRAVSHYRTLERICGDDLPSFCLAAVCLCLMLVTEALGQTTTGSLAGNILGPHGAPIPGVNVLCTSLQLLGTRGTTSDAAGRFRLEALAPGTYTIKISHVSFAGIEVRNVVVSLGETTTLRDIRLTEKTLESGEISVVAARSRVNLSSSRSVCCAGCPDHNPVFPSNRKPISNVTT